MTNYIVITKCFRYLYSIQRINKLVYFTIVIERARVRANPVVIIKSNVTNRHININKLFYFMIKSPSASNSVCITNDTVDITQIRKSGSGRLES